MELSPREKRNLERLYPYLAECTLFLKRDHHFPIDKAGTIAAYGRGVRHTIKGGSGSGDVNARFFTTIEEGLEKAGFNIVNKDYLDHLDTLYPLERKKWIKQTKKDARKFKMLSPIYAIGRVMPEMEYEYPLNYNADIAIYVVSRMAGEGSDREFKKGDILLTDSEVRDILLLNRKYEKFMLVINAGGVVDLSRVSEVRNILLLSELGTETGRVLADILLGKINPSGKLAATWAKPNDYPYDKEIPLDNTYYKDGRYVGYRYFDSFNVEPLYPFGYGLSYTTFKLDNFSVTHNKNNIEISLIVKNTGHYKGKEVVQAYISYLGKDAKVYQELIGFSKTEEISPNKEAMVSLSIDLAKIARYDLNRELYYLAKGEYLLRVGSSSRNTTPIAIIDLAEEIITKEAKNIFQLTGVEELKADINIEKPSKLTKISLNQLDFDVISNKGVEPLIPDEIKSLSTDELISLNIGYYGKERSLTFVGEASTAAPGAAGEISSVFVKHFNHRIVMADGPAGLRLTKSYYKKGNKIKKIDINGFVLEALDFLPQPFKWLLKKILVKDIDTDKIPNIYHQYCTALPIATALAQSFNKELAYLCGDIVGGEMEEYNIDLWLAPAMNIQRTIMCGRNFEYYSEDPYLTGMMAFFVTKGVQSHPHKGVVIKHFAANNQETFRYVSNSVVNEDTLREIYLRGFEICIKEASPKGVMSSYNLINDIHASENDALLGGYLYNENAYEGVVMTDWILRGSRPRLASYDISRVERVYKASTSLFMPGSKYDVKRLTKDIKKHPENRRLLEINATRLYKNFTY